MQILKVFFISQAFITVPILACVFMTNRGLGDSPWGTEFLSAPVVCNPWLRIIYTESRSVNTTMT